jgi:hypothetical protein
VTTAWSGFNARKETTMKKLLPSLLVLAIATPALAQSQPESVTQVLKDDTTFVALALNDKTVFCTQFGYGEPELKVSVPDLDWLAHFDHRVVGELLPCMAAGPCSENLQPGNIIDPTAPITRVPVRVVLKASYVIDHTQKTCERTLQEEVHSVIRDRRFTHGRTGAPEAVDYDLCVMSVCE